MTELIDKNELLKKAVMISGPSGKSTYSVVFADDITNTKAIESYTKADLVAMLEDLLMEIFKESWRLECICDDLDGSAVDWDDIRKVIQQKINSLKENKDGKE